MLYRATVVPPAGRGLPKMTVVSTKSPAEFLGDVQGLQQLQQTFSDKLLQRSKFDANLLFFMSPGVSAAMYLSVGYDIGLHDLYNKLQGLMEIFGGQTDSAIFANHVSLKDFRSAVLFDGTDKTAVYFNKQLPNLVVSIYYELRAIKIITKPTVVILLDEYLDQSDSQFPQ